MLKIGIVGCGLQAATIAGYLDLFGDAYEVAAVMDINESGARERLLEKKVHFSSTCPFFTDLDSFITSGIKLDGIIIGTYCAAHTEVACRLEKLHVPLYIEKPVAISLEQIKELHDCFRNSPTPVQVSLPMRLSPLAVRAKEIIDSGKLGRIFQVTGFEDTDGNIYFTTWFRDAEKTGGMFMQKAVHDIDYLLYLSGIEPESVCAMRAKVWHTGDKDYDLSCDVCPDKHTCIHGPEFYFDRKGLFNSFAEAEKFHSGIYAPDGTFLRKRFCAISREIAIEDIGECIIKGKNGAHLVHTQNFIASRAASRRGGRLVGEFGSLEMDFNHGKLTFYSSINTEVENYTVDPGKLSHYGGDRALVKNFLHTMKTGSTECAVVTHGGVIMTLLAVYGLPQAKPFEWAMENGCGYSVRVTPMLWQRGKVTEVFSRVPVAKEE